MFCGDCNDESIASVIETFDGDVHIQHVGANQESECDLQDFVVLYQRGMLPNTKVIERSHRSLLSYYRIKSMNDEANVPWRNLSWYSRDKRFSYTPKSSCHCLKATCRTCFWEVTFEHVKVVLMRTNTRQWKHQWYVAFEGDDGVLTRVPPAVVSRIRGTLTTDGACTCGRCKHPLLKMPCQRSAPKSAEFDAEAVRAFSKYRAIVNQVIRKSPSSRSGKRTRRDFEMHEGTCAICLEDKFVSSNTCVMKRCSLNICSECHSTTRGICPLCDRSKLSDNVFFTCRGCEMPVRLKDFGHACVTCDDPTLCTRCFKSFAQCIRCECDNGKQKE